MDIKLMFDAISLVGKEYGTLAAVIFTLGNIAYTMILRFNHTEHLAASLREVKEKVEEFADLIQKLELRMERYDEKFSHIEKKLDAIQ